MSDVMRDASGILLDGIGRAAGPWVERTVERLLDAYGRVGSHEREVARAAATEAGGRAATRVRNELGELFATDPAEQRSTPLEIVRSLRVEATEVLRAAGVPPVERDPFDARAFPDDIYAIVPMSMADLGDDDLGPALLAWGLAKAKVLRARMKPPSEA